MTPKPDGRDRQMTQVPEGRRQAWRVDPRAEDTRSASRPARQGGIRGFLDYLASIFRHSGGA